VVSIHTVSRDVAWRLPLEVALLRSRRGDEGHAKIRRLLGEKYGWADRWAGLFQATSRSIAVRVTPR